MASNIYDKLSELYKIPLVHVAQKMGYSKPNLLILHQKFDELKSQYPEVWSNILSCKNNADKRTPEEYSLDLVSSWVFEDTLIKYCSKHVDIQLNGADANREILCDTRVSSSSDFVLCGRFLELINSYTKFWDTNKAIDLRNNKYIKLKNKESLILCIDVCSKNFFILDLKSDNISSEYIESHEPYGGKSAYRLHINNVDKVDLSILNIIKELKGVQEMR